ncbi:hypothetical protein SynRS9902_00909 [Synechococcus sp. RS9902]|nr:hypothetical protein SynRS9902_00909 [Synechococcus sp. RS9902]
MRSSGSFPDLEKATFYPVPGRWLCSPCPDFLYRWSRRREKTASRQHRTRSRNLFRWAAASQSNAEPVPPPDTSMRPTPSRARISLGREIRRRGVRPTFSSVFSLRAQPPWPACARERWWWVCCPLMPTKS